MGPVGREPGVFPFNDVLDVVNQVFQFVEFAELTEF